MGKKEEANEIIDELLASSSLRYSTNAKLKRAKAYWNKNENDTALKYLNDKKTSAPSNPFRESITYVKARIFTEEKDFKRARAEYAKLTRSKKITTRTQARRQIAWLHLLDGNYFYSAKQFSKLEKQIKADIARTKKNPKLLSTTKKLYKELSHAIFWKHYVSTELSKSQKRSLGLHKLSEKDVLKKIPLPYSRSYYQFAFRDTFLNPEGSNKEALHTVYANPQCFNDVRPDLHKTLSLLSKAEEYSFIAHEIDWYFAKVKSSSEAERFRNRLTRAYLYNEYGLPSKSVKEIQPYLDEPLPKFTLSCKEQLYDLAYPTAYLDDFKRVAKKHNVPLSLLYGLVRTESHFDRFAKSRVGALGLGQLMPATAKKEGLKRGQSLFDPSVNLNLAAKHLARLLRKYNGNATSSIAAYNAGARAVNRWRKRYPELNDLAWTELISYSETKNYVKKVRAAESVYLEKLANKS